MKSSWTIWTAFPGLRGDEGAFGGACGVQASETFFQSISWIKNGFLVSFVSLHY